MMHPTNPAGGLVETPTAPSQKAQLLLTLPMSLSQPEDAVSHIELEEHVPELFDHLEPRQVHATYCGLQAPKRRLPKGVPVKKAVPSWGFGVFSPGSHQWCGAKDIA